MGNLRDLKGKTFGRLYVIERGKNRNGFVCWICKCDCGKTVEIRSCSLVSGRTKSCGCLNLEVSTKRLKDLNTTHGKTNHKLYSVFTAMKQRCYDKNNKDYKYYGLREITICDEWLNDFMSFFNFAMSNGWKEGLEIDRENNDSDYTPENCRFVTRKVNNNNRRNSVKDNPSMIGGENG